MRKLLAALTCLCIIISLFPTLSLEANAHAVVMTSDQFINYLQYVVNRGDSKYGSGDQYSIGKYDGTYIYFDCWGLGESIICTAGQIVYNRDTSVNPWNLWNTSCGCSSQNGDWLKTQCGNTLSSDFSNMLPGEWLFKDGSNGSCYHVGYYIGNNKVIESTTDGTNNTQVSTIDSSGHSNIRGSTWTWTYHGQVPWIGYSGGSYISKCTEYPSYLTVKNTTATTVKSLPCSAGTDSNSKDVVTLAAGSTFNVTAIYKNTAGNYWYKGSTADGKAGYLYSGHASVQTYRYDDVTISGVSAPSELTIGSRFSIKGTITSTINILSCVNGYIYPNGVNSGSNFIYGETAPVNGRSYSLLNGAIDNALLFNELQAGSYNYVITASVYNYYCTDGSTIESDHKDVLLVSKPFTVGGVTKYYLDVNGLLDNEEQGNTAGFGTFDMYINGAIDANDVTDYYKQWPAGTKYEIKDIKPASGHTYMGIVQGSQSGTVGASNVNIRLSFVTGLPITDTPVISSDKTVYKTTETVTLRRNTVANTNFHWIVLWKGDEQILSTSMPNTTYTLNNMSEGTYYVFLQVGNMTGSKTSEAYYFYVEDQHDYHYSVTKAPTTASSGELTGTCSKCSGTTTVTLPVLNTTDYNYTVVSNPSCTVSGTGRYTWKTTTYGTYSFDVILPQTAHNYVDTVTAPSCTSQGYTTHTCSYCGDNYKDTYTAALGHNYSYSVSQAPTTTATGSLKGNCSRCSGTTTVTLPVLNTTDYNYTVVSTSSCTVSGTGRYTWKTTTYGTYSFDVILPQTAHNYVDTVTAPSCTSQGYTMHTCTNCSSSYVDSYVSALGHDWGDWGESTAPTCTEKGEETRNCSRCEARETREIAALGHDWGKASYKWSEDNSSVTATRTCKRDKSHKETETVNTTYQVTREATIEAEGEGVYTATFSNKAFKTQTKTVAIPKLPISNPFVDVKESDFFFNPVMWAIEKNVTSGTDATHFSPYATVKRSEAMLFFYAAKGRPAFKTTTSPFKDVKKKHWYYDAVLWAVENKITSGTDATHFSPNKTCIRSEILQFLYAAMDKPEYTIENPYSDVKKKHWYYDGAIWAYENGLEKGSNGKFKAKTPCTRAYVVTYLYRFITGKELVK